MLNAPATVDAIAPSAPAYAELHCLTNFTFLRGASHPHEVVEQARALGYKALAITDECSVGGVVRAYTALEKIAPKAPNGPNPPTLPLKLIIGSEFRLECGLRFVALAMDRRGYGKLCRLITRGRRAAAKGSYSLTRADVLQTNLEQCFLLWIPPSPRGTDLPAVGFDPEPARWLARHFGGKVRIAVELLRDGTDSERLAALEALGRDMGLPLVACGDVHMHVRQRRPLQDALTAIRLNIPIAEAGWHLLPNGERYLRERERLAKLYPARLLEETVAIADACTFSLSELRYEYPRELVPEGETPTSYLRKLTEEGARKRWPEGVPRFARTNIENELALIAELKYEPYFLTVQDIVRAAEEMRILCQGRGSAANSTVCYCLRVTAVDPGRASLLFERFISRERHEPPDIDIDFEHERREEVIQYVYTKYGRERAALAATVIMYRPRSALRDAAKAFGLDTDQCTRLTKVMQWWDGSDVMPERLAEAGFNVEDPVLVRILSVAHQLVLHPGFPRHLSQHVGGFVISEGVLEELVPIENATMPDRTVVQWDKDDLNDLGLLKVDLLGLGMMSALRRALVLVNEFEGRSDVERSVIAGQAACAVRDGVLANGIPYTLSNIPGEDPKVYDMCCKADTVGVFQIESRAQMAMLPRLKPRNYYDLVVQIAIVRPGPIQGDMVHPYLQRRKELEEARASGRSGPRDEGVGGGSREGSLSMSTILPSAGRTPADEVLARTLGVPIFQEQVMQLAIVAAGFTPGEADSLRRAMGAWKRTGGLEHFKEKLLTGMREREYSEEFAQRIYKQMMGFGEYGFPECVVGETRVVDADTGRWVFIDDVISGKASLRTTLACDERLRLCKREVVAIKSSGVKPVWRLRTALGHTIVATAEHPFMTMDGWRKLGTLQLGDHIAAARTLPLAGRLRWPRHEVLVLADLIAEGNLCHPNTFCFYTTARWHCDEFVKAVECFPNTRAVVERNKNCFSVRVKRIDRQQPAGAVLWARELGIWGRGARLKQLPPAVFELCASNIALLLARLWEGDGSFSEAAHASYDTASQQLATEVQHLLLRLGIVARLYCRRRLYEGRRLEYYVVTVTGTEPLQRFWRFIGRRFLDTERHRKSKALAACRTGRMSRDIIPAAVRMIIRKERDASGLSWVEIGQVAGVCVREVQARGGCKIGFRRSTIGRLASALRSPELAQLANSDIYWDQVVQIEALDPQPTYDLEIDGNHNFLANNLVVHNSHSASFALLAYSSAWLKCHKPAAFTCALLNSQPMGFYAPAQLVRDAREHGVEVRPVDVQESDYECTLERREEGGEAALRLGLILVKSLSETGAKRLVAARAAGHFESVQALAKRAALDRGDLEALAAAGALAALSGNRHLAFWEVAGTEKALPLAPPSLRPGSIEEGRPLLQAPTEGQRIIADYSSVGLTLGRHPMALLRDGLRKRLLSAAELGCVAHGKWVRTAGIVLMRQRPQSASGVTFLTIEDETGQVNLVVWESVGRAQRRALVESKLLEVYGELQRQDGITHLIARQLTDRSALLGRLLTRSRDFR
jgi:DNA-directed DNA polymerase III PolC